MKTIKIFIAQLLSIALIALSSCDLTCEPYNAVTSDKLAGSLADLQMVTRGVYGGVVNADYTRQYHFANEYCSDNVTLSSITTDALYFTYNYAHVKRQANVNTLWSRAYRTLFGANTIIENTEGATDPAFLQLRAECLYLRAMIHFDLSRIWGRPYTHDNPATNPCVPIVKSTGDESVKPARSTVKEVYDFIINDLNEAITLFTQTGVAKNSCYASREVCYALLSRIYLNMEENEKAIDYANRVISSGRYRLVDTQTLPSYFRSAPEDNPETIFAVKHTATEDRSRSAIGSMYYELNGSGWGEVYASQDIVDLTAKYPEDVRNKFIELQFESDGVTPRKRNGILRYYVLKYSYQQNIVNLSSPVYLRLAEMYMNRAEANTKLGKYQEAIDDVNMIRERAGLSGSALYTVDNLKGHSSVLDVVLEERRLEFAFECLRKHDLFRNKRDLVRHYPGYHVADVTDGYQLIPWTSPRVVHYIPEQDIMINPNLIDNP